MRRKCRYKIFVCIWQKSENVSLSIMSNSLQLHGLQPARLLCPWNSLGKNTGLGSYSLLQGDFPNPGIKPESHPLWADSLPSEPPRKPYIWQKAINKVTREGLTVNMEFQGALSCHLP